MSDVCISNLMSCFLQQLGGRQSSHAGSDYDNMMRRLDGGEAVRHRVHQVIVVGVVQAFGQVFLNADRSDGSALAEQQQRNCRHTKTNIFSFILTYITGKLISRHFKAILRCSFKDLSIKLKLHLVHFFIYFRKQPDYSVIFL